MASRLNAHSQTTLSSRTTSSKKGTSGKGSSSGYGNSSGYGSSSIKLIPGKTTFSRRDNVSANAYRTVTPAASLLLQKRWDEMKYDEHRRKVICVLQHKDVRGRSHDLIRVMDSFSCTNYSF